MLDIVELRARAQVDPIGVRRELEAADLPAFPRAQYLLAQLLARAGRSEDALGLIDEAEASFLIAGEELDAWRCDAGRADVLGNLGRHHEALEAAQRFLTRLESSATTDIGLLAGALANLGACYEQLGRDRDALVSHERAIDLAVGDGDLELAAIMQLNRSNVLNRLGRSSEALKALRASAAVLQASELDDDLAAVATNAGETACLLGRPDEGLEWFALATRLVDPDGNDGCVVKVETANALVTLGAAEEAASRYREALAWLAEHPLRWIETRAWLGLGVACALLQDRTGAVHAFTQSKVRADEDGNVAGSIQATLELAQLGATDALESVRALLDRIDTSAWPVQAAVVHLRLAESLEASDRRAAREHLAAALELATAAAIPHLLYRAHHRLGVAHRRDGRPAEAAEHLRAATAIIERLRRQLTNETILRCLPLTTADVYDDLVRLLVEQGSLEEAFAIADRARSRTLVDLTRTNLAPDSDDEITTLTTDLDAIYDQLLGVDGQLSLEDRRRLDETARVLEVELTRHRFELAPSTWSEARTLPSPPRVERRPTLLFDLDGEVVNLFVRHRGAVTHFPGLMTLSEVGEHLDRLHTAGRRALALAGSRGSVAWQANVSAAVLAASVRKAESHLERLGALFPAAVWDLVTDIDVAEIVVVPNGMLHGVPFHALRRDGRAVIDSVAVSLAPSLAVREKCLAHATPSTNRTVLVGQPSLELPGVAAELRALASLLADVVVLSDGAATMSAVADAALGSTCLHLATHGMFRPEAPLQSGIRLADAWLTAERASVIDLTGALVVLSACDTGRSVVHAGDEILGLQRGFLAAGASAVVMSLWPARDDATVELMARFHAALADGHPPAVALRLAQLEVRERHEHPWWWAPFVVTGAG